MRIDSTGGYPSEPIDNRDKNRFVSCGLCLPVFRRDPSNLTLPQPPTHLILPQQKKKVTRKTYLHTSRAASNLDTILLIIFSRPLFLSLVMCSMIYAPHRQRKRPFAKVISRFHHKQNNNCWPELCRLQSKFWGGRSILMLVGDSLHSGIGTLYVTFIRRF